VNGRRAESTQDASYLIRLYQGSTIDFTINRQDPRTGSELIETSAYARWDPPSYTDECGVERAQGPTGITIGSVSVLPVQLTPEELADYKKASADSYRAYKKEIASDAPAWCYGGAAFGFSRLSEAQCADLSPEGQADARALRDDLFPDSDAPCYEFRSGTVYETITRTESEPIWDAVPNGTRLAFESLILARNQVWSWIRGYTSPQFAGPVGIAQTTGEVVDQAGWRSLLSFAALLSMNLAVLNILPIPMFDGGRLFFIFIEAIRGKRIAPQKEALVHLAGFIGIILLTVVITYFDIVRVLSGDSLLR
jgi:hypothetical protein